LIQLLWFLAFKDSQIFFLTSQFDLPPSLLGFSTISKLIERLWKCKGFAMKDN